MDATPAPQIPAWARVRVVDDAAPETVVRSAATGPSPDIEREAAYTTSTAFLRELERRYGWQGVDGAGGELTVTTNWGGRGGAEPYQNAVAGARHVESGTVQAPSGKVVLTTWPQYLQHEIVHAIHDTVFPHGLPMFASIKEGWADFLPAAIEDHDWRIYDDRAPELGVAYDLDAPVLPGTRVRLERLSQLQDGTQLEMHQPGKLTSLVGTRVAASLGRDVAAELWFRAMTEHLAAELEPYVVDQPIRAAIERSDPNGTWAFAPAARATVSAARDAFGEHASQVDVVRRAWTSIGVDLDQRLDDVLAVASTA